jgi:EmrB/QacA subfamily drug resistance transporter
MIIGMRSSKDRTQASNARWIALLVVCLGLLMSVIDGTIVNVALPQIQHSLRFSQGSLSWVLNGYLITYGSFLLLGGRLGDLIGRRRVFLYGVALFTLASAACGLAQSQEVLVAARFVQGLGGAGAVSGIIAIITREFQAPGERARAMSFYTFVISGGAALGLLAGGVITDLLDWHWIFFVNVPIGITTVLLGRMWLIEDSGTGIGRDIDVIGSALITGGLVAIVYAIVTASSDGWGSTHTLGFGALGLGLVGAFTLLEHRLQNPIMPLHVFAVKGLPSTSLIRGLLLAAMYDALFIGVLYLEHVRHYGALTTGLAFLPQSITMALITIGPIAWLVRRYGPRLPLTVGLLCAGAGLVLLARAGEHQAYLPLVCGALVLVGLGPGLAFMPLLITGMSRVPPASAGLASGIINTSLQLSAAIGIAVFGTLSTNRFQTQLHHGVRPTAALLSGYHLAFWVGAGLIAAALIAALAWVHPQRSEIAPASAPRRAGSAKQPLDEVPGRA